LHQTSDSFGVGTCFKNGKPKKTPSVWLRYIDPTQEEVFDLETQEILCVEKELTGNERPWRVDSWRLKAGKTYHDLHSAFAMFVQEVRASDPSTAKGAFSGH
jgi:hypothetical protein